ncbi:MAG: hypothetical protein HYS17_07335 [Micavibrio aeruginosavorus]|uniref:Uncharacterized protein n=1 Tax=Micavibrio aeruginosavorus TaxID=349221 RepID=A0A7T5UGV8_9BACT|nr:MAG: hypothetical protein HYS17_07335 [Micavibrio aeruginosavorus]
MSVYDYTLHVTDRDTADKVTALFQELGLGKPDLWGPKWISGKMANGLVAHWTEALMADGQLEKRLGALGVVRLALNPFAFENIQP